MEHNGNVPVERHRESRLVDRDPRTLIPPAGNLALTRSTAPASTLSTALTPRAANVPTVRSSFVPSQDVNVQPTLRPISHHGAGAAYESGAAQPSGNDVPPSVNNQNYNANPVVDEGINSRIDGAYRRGKFCCSLSYRMDRWMTCDFTSQSFLTIFQSYQDDV